MIYKEEGAEVAVIKKGLTRRPHCLLSHQLGSTSDSRTIARAVVGRPKAEIVFRSQTHIWQWAERSSASRTGIGLANHAHSNNLLNQTRHCAAPHHVTLGKGEIKIGFMG